MKLLSAQTSEGPRLAAKLDGGVLVFSQLTTVFPDIIRSIPLTLQEIAVEDGGIERFVTTIATVIADRRVSDFLIPEEKIQISKPFQPRNILCVGLNYKDHAEESNIPPPTQPVLFAKWTSAAGGPGDPIILPPDTNEVDYEAELAVIIGRRCRSVTTTTALEYVAGYACMNDVSARDFQRGDGQWVRAKSQDTFGPFGPYLVTKDEVPDPQSLPIRCILNGRTLQDSNTNKMIFGVRELVAFITRGITLNPGDVISTGTPHGVGFAQKPPVFLKPGDNVKVEIDGVGRLSNKVIAAE
jgi:2-keto-4-pentenoate hydratase/2-oxohepta-3-ene-1,7-dioic acid hydratase in catechol pathway